MTDDIVTRLRQEWEYGNNAKGCDYEMFAEAANEIERLRAERSHWQGQYESAMSMIDKMDDELEQFHNDYNMVEIVAKYGEKLENAWDPERLAEFQDEIIKAEERHRAYEWNLIMKKRVAGNE